MTDYEYAILEGIKRFNDRLDKIIELLRPDHSAEKRKMGKWEWVEEKAGTLFSGETIFDAHSKCSECGARPFDDMDGDELLTPYCPNCGAKMMETKEGEKNEQVH